MSYTIHTQGDAPVEAREILVGATKGYGFIPNLLGTMAAAPSLLKAYTTLSRLFDETSFTATERQIVLLTVSRGNKCHYCMAAHTAIASMNKVPADVINAIRDDKSIEDNKLEALRQFTRSVVANRGYPAEDVTKRFFDAGYAERQVLEVILGVGMKTLSNFTNHIAEVPLDDAFKKMEWTDSE